MSFPRAPIKRFNEHADTSIPPLGTYDPKFVTDVSQSVLDKISKLLGPRARSSEDTNEPPSGRASRDNSCTQLRRSFTSTSSSTERSHGYATPTKASLSKTRIITTLPCKFKIRSSGTSPTRVGPLKAHEIPGIGLNGIYEKKDFTSHETQTVPEYIPTQDQFSEIETCNLDLQGGCMQEFQEIQDGIGALQAENTELKRNLTEERIRSSELNATKAELSFRITSLKRELEKSDAAKVDLESGLYNYKTQLEEARVTIEDLKKTLQELEKLSTELNEKIKKHEVEKFLWRDEKQQYNVEIQKLKNGLIDERAQRERWEDKCKELRKELQQRYASAKEKEDKLEKNIAIQTSGDALREIELQKELVGKIVAMQTQIGLRKSKKEDKHEGFSKL